MITQMMKYSFILLSDDENRFMDRIRDLGVVDISRSAKPVDSSSTAIMDKTAKVRKAVSILQRTDFSKDADFAAIEAKASKSAAKDKNAESLADEVFSLKDRLEQLRSEITAKSKEVALLSPWGVYDKARLDSLAGEGVHVHYFSVRKKKFSPVWASQVALQVVSDDGDIVRFVTLTYGDEKCPLPISECDAPQSTVTEVSASLAALKEEELGCKAALLTMKSAIPELEAEYASLAEALDMYLAKVSGEKSSENMVVTYEGFAPVQDDERLCKAFDTMDVYYLKSKATDADNPPIKLHNNRFVRMFEVLTGMYGLPAYNEFDPTPILGPFFLLFFAMCLGDAGYGMLLVAAGILLRKKMPSMAPLVTTLGCATIVVGFILGTFFGISLPDAAWIPSWMKKCMITGTIMGFSTQMVLAIGIGVFHICLAMIVKALCYTKRGGLRSTVSNWAWIFLIVGCICTGGLALAGVIDNSITKVVIIVIGVLSALGIFVFNTPGRNPLINIGAGLWDTYNMATGLMGDVLSYIRLYALGLAGGMLGMAFNTIAGLVFDGIPVPGLNWLFFVIVLLAGHALNIGMSCLGAFVHPLRLTFVEYFKNSGYEGTGKRYRPLANNM